MSAARLREASRVLRERADDAAVAHGIDWRTSEDAIYRVQTETAGVRGEVQHRCYACGGLASTAEKTATFIATMHPGVALIIADWLDSTANDVEHVHPPIYNLTSTTVSRAVAVADAILER